MHEKMRVVSTEMRKNRHDGVRDVCEENDSGAGRNSTAGIKIWPGVATIRRRRHFKGGPKPLKERRKSGG